MSKQKRKSQQKQRMVPPASAATPISPKPHQAMAGSSRSAQPAKSDQRPKWIWLAILVSVLIGGGLLIWLVSRSQAATSVSLTPTVSRVAGPIGGVTNCRVQPKFTLNLGFGRSVILSTADRTTKGLLIFEPQESGPARIYQHPSWTQAGYLGANAIDKDGNIFLARSPRVNLIDNPPDQQNKLYRVDTGTGVMTEFINLPFVITPSLNNPYGVLGLAYDCDTNSLYASSVAGSSRREEIGRIYQIDLNTGKIVSQLDDVDAIGLGVFNGAGGKRLYFGSARTQEMRSIPLDVEGKFAGSQRPEFSLEGLGPDGNEKVRKVSFDRGADMLLNGTKFNYNLAPPPAQVRPTTYRYRYDATTDTWSFVDATTSPGGLQ